MRGLHFLTKIYYLSEKADNQLSVIGVSVIVLLEVNPASSESSLLQVGLLGEGYTFD